MNNNNANDNYNDNNEAWQRALEAAGNVRRPRSQDGISLREQVYARSYRIGQAADRLNFQARTIEQAITHGLLNAFIDPDNVQRIPAGEVEAAKAEPALYEEIAGYQRVKVNDLILARDADERGVRADLREAHLSATKSSWNQLRGRWDLPETWQEFRERVKKGRQERNARKREERRRKKIERRRKRREREAQLREQLLELFPDWQHEERQEQQVSLHIGGPNSGKTHDALEALIEAETGWYLAPLRLLAYEIFDRLNRRGVLCNLLTGEEHIPVPGATITAATIEMFNPQQSGELVIIDEAQMLADSDRGWAWTRALMEAKSPEIHVIGPKTAQNLIERMAAAADLPVHTTVHDRLTPIRVANKFWPLDKIPDHTIVVAFSRQTVLHLKTELELKGRSVSVVYGSLPPEVRRKQADRFADGETQICIATDAVGMGLNLPADNVCFYEIEKFDGKQIRRLLPAEVQQIGGRAGRYGLSSEGVVGATTRRNLRFIEKTFYADAPTLTHARIAPTVDDLMLLPGHLSEQLQQWAKLQSIPQKLRETIKTADLSERIELAKMLTSEEIQRLGLDAALQLVNAPTRKSSRLYWRECASAILADEPMPLPPNPPRTIQSSRALDRTESCISCADIYMWLAHRREFHVYGPELQLVREARIDWSNRIDEALLRKVDTSRRCPKCGRSLSPKHRHKLCDDCYYVTWDYELDYEFDE
ncbi:MAG: hypothetical protein CUN54_02985 [Phototrophicales bacterium]|nr:MAG: hypothetical protein CUN54_02985 [Phototrophicales bacterium]